ncbi:hypothetical protein CABS02_14233 [Colletotrichum abscissum]|uniref:Uncharacterized protein n=1 Tax=Colletotrichum abscissum TaxID=1671311 RepID=A0A9P9X1Q8_9PEZI|nr:hypothetical protein CABS02_14233 [Colletotrichum abscissum]
MRSSGAFLAPFGRWEEWETMLYPLLIASLRLGNGADQVDEHSWPEPVSVPLTADVDGDTVICAVALSCADWTVDHPIAGGGPLRWVVRKHSS